QSGHARHVAVVLAGLVRAAHESIIQCCPVHARITLSQRPDRYCSQVVGPYRRKCAAIAAERSANRIADKCLSRHGRNLRSVFRAAPLSVVWELLLPGGTYAAMPVKTMLSQRLGF